MKNCEFIYARQHAYAFRNGSTTAQESDKADKHSDANENIWNCWYRFYDLAYSDGNFENKKTGITFAQNERRKCVQINFPFRFAHKLKLKP